MKASTPRVEKKEGLMRTERRDEPAFIAGDCGDTIPMVVVDEDIYGVVIVILIMRLNVCRHLDVTHSLHDKTAMTDGS
jgi:hypothetical protein